MKLTVQFVAILILAALASPVFLLNGCGEALNGGQCGGCPDSLAPAESSIVVTNRLGSYTVGEGSYCVNRVAFTVMAGGKPLGKGICVELFTNGGITLSQGGRDCTDSTLVYSQYIRTRTDYGGTVTVDFATGYLFNSTCGTGNEKDASYSLFVQASSCTKGDTTRGTWTVKCSL